MTNARSILARVSPARWLARFHADERGNLGVLILLTLWALVALIGVVWNGAEYATRRRHVQTAADSVAHAGNLWTSRTTNLTASTNLVIAENGSAEAILRSVTPTRTQIDSRLTSEQKRATQLRDGDTVSEPERNIPDCEYFEELLGSGAWSGKGQGDKLRDDLAKLTPQINAALKRLTGLPNPPPARVTIDLADRLRRNDVALQWLLDKWVGGTVRPAVQPWIEQQVRPRLDDILRTIPQERQWYDRFVTQTDPALQTTPEDLRAKRDEIYDYQTQIRDLTASVVEEQRAKLAEFYKCDLTIAVPGQQQSDRKPADVSAPIIPASEPESLTRVDSIRQRYPGATEARFGSSDPSVTVDPINVNVLNDVIWHPGQSVDAPGGIILAKEEYSGTYHVGGGEWGQLPCAPLSRYFNNRIDRDREGLRLEPQKIDGVRDDLRGRVYPPPDAPGLDDMPRRIPDPKAGGKDIPLPLETIPTLPIPAGLNAADLQTLTALNAAISQYNSDVRRYVSELRGLSNALQRMQQHLSSLTDSASTRFADAAWLRNVEDARKLVLYSIGQDRSFMVLATYKLRDIPDWAQAGMQTSAHDYVYHAVYQRNYARLLNEARSRLEQWAYKVLYGSYQQQAKQNGGKGAGQAASRARSDAKRFANQTAPGMARYMIDQASESIASEVAAEWVRRPWPYEIDPPKESVPPTRGLTDDDRQRYFSFVAAAKTTDDSAPHPFLPKVFAASDRPMVAFAQGETFNWMEFNEQYGAGDPYDAVTDYRHGSRGGAPRPWRLGTTGGWTWQPRLALSDALGRAMEDGAEFRAFLEEGGVTSYDPDAIKTLTVH